MPICETSHSERIPAMKLIIEMLVPHIILIISYSYFENFVMLEIEVPHVIISEMLSSGKFPRKERSGWGKSTHGTTF